MQDAIPGQGRRTAVTKPGPAGTTDYLEKPPPHNAYTFYHILQINCSQALKDNVRQIYQGRNMISSACLSALYVNVSASQATGQDK